MILHFANTLLEFDLELELGQWCVCPRAVSGVEGEMCYRARRGIKVSLAVLTVSLCPTS